MRVTVIVGGAAGTSMHVLYWVHHGAKLVFVHHTRRQLDQFLPGTLATCAHALLERAAGAGVFAVSGKPAPLVGQVITACNGFVSVTEIVHSV